MYIVELLVIYLRIYVGSFISDAAEVGQAEPYCLCKSTDNSSNSSLFSITMNTSGSFSYHYNNGLNRNWLPRGRRAGFKTKIKEATRKLNIPVIAQPRKIYSNYNDFRGVNTHNLVVIPVAETQKTFENQTSFVPNIMLSNTMSLVPKLIEIQELLLRLNVEIACIVETWRKNHIDDTVVNIEGYNVIRKDRTSHEHGGVCIYLKDNIKYETIGDLQCCEHHEIIWIKLNLKRIPRGFSCIILAVVYYPGRTSPAESDATNIINHLFDSLMTAESIFPNCGIIITGDFNRLNLNQLKNHFKLKQLVKFHTRGTAILDLILTNMDKHFSTPECFPPLGLSDHNTVFLKPALRIPNQHTRKTVTIRDMRESNRARLGRYFACVDWSCLYSQNTCENKSKVFNDLFTIGLENILPEKSIKIYPTDTPWMSVKLKNLIHQRQIAFHKKKTNSLSYKFYRNAVNKERKRCKAAYYASKVKDLKGVNQRKWWDEISKLSGSKKKNSNLQCSLNIPEYNDKTNPEIANAINEALLDPLQILKPLDPESADVFLPLEENPEFLEVPAYRVYNNLIHLNKKKPLVLMVYQTGC